MTKGQIACLMNHWPQALHDMRPPTHAKDITNYAETIVALGYGEKYDEDIYVQLLSFISPLFDGCEKFIRLNSRSPKDRSQKPVFTAEEAVAILSTSMRATDDIMRLTTNNQQIFLYCTNYNHRIKNKEFRGFIHEREFIALTQYDSNYHDQRYLIEAKGAAKALAKSLLSIIPMDNFVFDFWFDTAAHFIEINPWGLSDPILLDYDTMDNDFAFLSPVKVPLHV